MPLRQLNIMCYTEQAATEYAMRKQLTSLYDVFAKQQGSWKFAERVESTSTETAKRKYMKEHPELNSWDICVYHRK